MLDIRWIRQDPEEARARLATRGAPELTDAAVGRVLKLDEERRRLVSEGDTAKAKRNEVSLEVGERKRSSQPAEDLIVEMRSVGDRIKWLDGRLREVELEIEDILLRTPNVPHPSVPSGSAESNVVAREWGQAKAMEFEPKPHWDLGADLGLIDLPAGAKVAGSGFPVFKGAGARLQRALIGWMLDLHTREHGYLEVAPPFLVHRDSMRGTGQYPKFVEDGDAYEVPEDGLYLIPTAEVPVTNLHREELLDGDRLPIRYVAYSPCFQAGGGSRRQGHSGPAAGAPVRQGGAGSVRAARAFG
jgi:seryl-tRNA synthetase